MSLTFHNKIALTDFSCLSRITVNHACAVNNMLYNRDILNKLCGHVIVIHPRELLYKRNQKVGETQFRIQLQIRLVCHSLFIIK